MMSRTHQRRRRLQPNRRRRFLASTRARSSMVEPKQQMTSRPRQRCRPSRTAHLRRPPSRRRSTPSSGSSMLPRNLFYSHSPRPEWSRPTFWLGGDASALDNTSFTAHLALPAHDHCPLYACRLDASSRRKKGKRLPEGGASWASCDLSQRGRSSRGPRWGQQPVTAGQKAFERESACDALRRSARCGESSARTRRRRT